MANQYVYAFTNPCLSGFVKVGKAKDLKQRLKSLSRQTAIPLAFECYAYLEVPSELVFNIETALHHFLGTAYDQKKEFFKTTPELVLNAFEDVVRINPSCKLVITNDEQEEPAAVSSAVPLRKKTNTTFELLQLPVGTVLSFKDDQSIKCTVADKKNQVNFNGSLTTLSHIACELKQFSVNGFDYFIYEGETLFERRLRLEKTL